MKINKFKQTDYLLLLFVLFVSGAPYFNTSILYIPLFIILLFFFIIRKREYDIQFIFLLFLLFLVTLIQYFVFDFFSFQTSLGAFLRVIIGYLIVKNLNNNFIQYYINSLYYLAIFSMLIYLPTLLTPSVISLYKSFVPFFSFSNISDSDHLTIVLYNLNHLESFRNPGPFWEAGAFAGYLILAYMFNIIINGTKKTNVVLLLAILTTFSTTAYIAIFVFWFFRYLERTKKSVLKFFSVLAVLFIGYYSYNTFDFLGKKIEHQLSFIELDPNRENTNTQRFLNILRDVEDFKGHEFFGRGGNSITRYSFTLTDQIRTVGLTDILVRMGLIYFLFMFFMIYHSIKMLLNYFGRYDIIFLIGIFLTIIIILMSEVYFNHPIFWCLLFLQFVYKKPKLKINNPIEFTN
jgi:hypothetical protein